MKPNVKNIRKLIETEFGGNQAKFARVIGIDRSQVSHIIKSGNCAGANFLVN